MSGVEGAEREDYDEREAGVSVELRSSSPAVERGLTGGVAAVE